MGDFWCFSFGFEVFFFFVCVLLLLFWYLYLGGGDFYCGGWCVFSGVVILCGICLTSVFFCCYGFLFVWFFFFVWVDFVLDFVCLIVGFVRFVDRCASPGWLGLGLSVAFVMEYIMSSCLALLL